MKDALLFFLATAAIGCGPTYTTMTMPDVNSPVTLGPTTRIGGHRANGEKVVAHVKGEASDFAAATREEKKIGGDVVEVTHKTTRISTGSELVSSQIMARTENDFHRETRIDGIDAGAWFFISTGAAMADRWVGVSGRVVEVDHVR